MTYRIMSNKKNKSATVLFTANTTLTIAGNSGTSAIAVDDEVLAGCQIDSAWHGCPDGSWVRIRRGANTVSILSTTGFADFAGNGGSITLDSGATLVVELNGTNPSTLVLNLKKIGRGSTVY